MKKSINIGIILLFLLQACSGEENIESPVNSPQVLENPVENEIIETEVQEKEQQSKPEANTEIADIELLRQIELDAGP